MPITQERMLAVIAAAQAYLQQYRFLVAKIRTAEAAQSPQDAVAAIQELAMARTYTETMISPEHAAVLATETTHFKHVARRNDRYRQRRHADPSYISHLPVAKPRQPARPLDYPNPAATPTMSADAAAADIADADTLADVHTGGLLAEDGTMSPEDMAREEAASMREFEKMKREGKL